MGGMDEQIQRLADRLRETDAAVAFTGAGVSTESGIADFRSPGGVWTRYRTVYYDEFVRSADARREYWRMKKELYPEFMAARPNPAHRVLADFEKAGLLRGVITQNIDGLHQEAGSRRVLELHGTGRFVECIGCGQRWPSPEIFEKYRDADAVPECDRCGGVMKPAVVMFGEMLPEDVLEEARSLSSAADVYLAIGSSLVVEPAASLPLHAKHMGAFLAIINRDPTPLDAYADVLLRGSAGEILSRLAALVVAR